MGDSPQQFTFGLQSPLVRRSRLSGKWESQQRTRRWRVQLSLKLEILLKLFFCPKMPFVCDSYDNCKPLGRMAAMDSNSLIMLGKVTAVVAKPPKGKSG